MVTRIEMVEMLGTDAHGVIDNNHELSGVALDANPSNRATKTYTGVSFDMFNPDSWEFRREDIARSLSNACRWAGHIDPYTVGQHCLHVADILRDWGQPPEVQLLGLLHDASEAYLLDIPRPWKGEVSIGGMTYVEREGLIEAAIFEWAGPHVTAAREYAWGIVKEADVASFEVERASRVRDGKVVLPYAHPNETMDKYLQEWSFLDIESLTP